MIVPEGTKDSRYKPVAFDSYMRIGGCPDTRLGLVPLGSHTQKGPANLARPVEEPAGYESSGVITLRADCAEPKAIMHSPSGFFVLVFVRVYRGGSCAGSFGWWKGSPPRPKRRVTRMEEAVLVLAVSEWNFKADDGKEMEGGSVEYIMPLVEGNRDGVIGCQPMKATVFDKALLRSFHTAPAVYGLTFGMVPGKKAPVLAIKSAKLLAEVDLKAVLGAAVQPATTK